MNNFKKQCLVLRKAGHTLSEIVGITGRPKTSVYAHIRYIPLSKEKNNLIKLARSRTAINLAVSRRGKSDREFKKIGQWNKTVVSLLAHLIFDGTINSTSCIYNNRNKTLVIKVENSMKEIYSYEPIRWLNPLTGVSRISYHNVALAAHLKASSITLLNDICYLSHEMKREFVKSFFDDEGCVDFRPKRNLRQIRGYQKDISILFLVKKLLRNFDIDSRVVKPNEVVINGKENLQKFKREINFSSGVRLNENRANSIWKKPLEKQGLLNQAISSFKI